MNFTLKQLRYFALAAEFEKRHESGAESAHQPALDLIGNRRTGRRTRNETFCNATTPRGSR